jgi:N-succinyldiaminopimelate aminotransferase
MKALRPFYMEHDLETHRFHSTYNLGESGGRPRTVEDLLISSGLSKEHATETFFQTKLWDSPNWGRDDLRDVVASLHPGATRDNVLITTGTSEALFLLFRYLNPKSVAMAIPGFQLLYELPIAQGASLIPLPVRWDEHGVPFVDEDEWLAILTREKPSCLLINHPHNPTGLVFSAQFLSKLREKAREIGATLIGDEHYRFLSHPTKLLGETLFSQNDFITGSFIKCLGAPGLRIGWCVGPHKALAHMQNEKNYTTHTVNPLTEWISFEVLKNTDSPLFHEMKEEWGANTKSLSTFLSQSQTVYGAVPQGGLVTSLGLKHVGSQEEMAQKIKRLEEKKIFVLPLNTMEVGAFPFQNEKKYKEKPLCALQQGLGFRLGMGCAPHHFQTALEKIEEALR